MPQTPKLPYGSPTILSGLSETFSFHSSPENFITSRVLAFHKAHPAAAASRTPIHAKILSRNVAVISSYDHVRQVLCDEEIIARLCSSQAYNDLMAPFFPPPNLLLLDPPDHHTAKEPWEGRMAGLICNIRPSVHETVLDHFRTVIPTSTVDIYESMKTLSWKLLLSIFLPGEDKANSEIESLHEDLLRGQFSLFPISVNTSFWRSPRSKGLDARRTLESILSSKVTNGKCPFTVNNPDEAKDIANHLLLFTSSLAAKGLASLLTAVLLNLFLFKGNGSSIANQIHDLNNNDERYDRIQSMVRETQRLSPPVVGIMRRTTQDIILHPAIDQGESESPSPTLVPKGWDLWLYFVGAARDPAAFGDTAENFVPSRYSKQCPDPEGFAFGAGAKACLGKYLMNSVAVTVAAACLGLDQNASTTELPTSVAVDIRADLKVIPAGVRSWLGWEAGIKPEEWARDMKQLPTQRPRKPLMVKVIYHESP